MFFFFPVLEVKKVGTARALEASENWTRYPARSAGECAVPRREIFGSALCKRLMFKI